MIHIKGMGILGCLLALELTRRKVVFTWSDIGAKVNAWSACTGAIYPGDSDDEAGRIVWASRHFKDSPWLKHGWLERAHWIYNHKHPPHGGRYPQGRLGSKGQLGIASLPSYHLNAQRFVPHVRDTLEGLREKRPRSKHTLIVAHGFENPTHYYWGWTRLVKVDHDLDLKLRPAFYFRDGRFIMCYAYPIPDTDWWYAGSSIIKQNVPKPLEIEPKYEKWKENFQRLSGGLVRVVEEGEFIEGWRPADNNNSLYVVTLDDNVIQLPSMWNNGVRHSPRVIEQTIFTLKGMGVIK